MMTFLMEDWHGKPCPHVSFEVSKSTVWTFRVDVQSTPDQFPLSEPYQYKEGLWEQDVAEWFLVDTETQRYIEFNLAPNGAWWMMFFEDIRLRTTQPLPDLSVVNTTFSQQKHSWQAELKIPESLLLNWLGDTTWTHNVCFIIGHKPRQFISLCNLSSNTPDFHRPFEIDIPIRMPVNHWTIYILRCADNTLYTGITTNIHRRLNEHNGTNNLGARYTRSRRPVVLVYQEQATSRSAASKREYEIKKMSKLKKEKLINV